MVSDLRIPVIFGRADHAGPDDALLAEGGHPQAAMSFTASAADGHAPGCSCCAPRSEAARALASLVQARARGEVPFFRRVVACTATEAGRAALEAALAGDAVVASCYSTGDGVIGSAARPGRPGPAGAA